MALDTVADYVAQARVLLQDVVLPYRYDDVSLLYAFNNGILEAMRLRPDLFIGNTTEPNFTTVDTTAVTMDLGYRTGLVYYTAGFAQLRDDEINQDSRASAFMQQFKAQLLTLTT